VGEVVQDRRYAPYVARQDQEIARLRAGRERLGWAPISDYRRDRGPVERDGRAPQRGAAGAIWRRRGGCSGITPAALAAILVHARRIAA
jgi:tRNA uridine 5-carboxymethylaminomethyl modification enzyme